MPLSPKAFQLLELLLDRRPEAVAKAELLDHLWPDTFVSDASLHNLMTEIRSALGDVPRAARYIRTVPRYGYAFHGDVRLTPEINVSGSARSSARLVVGPREWLLSEGSNVVGRDRDCAVCIDSATISRHHARIEVMSGQSAVEDPGSKNGTQVNGQRVTQSITLKDNDRIQVGSVTMTYRILDTLPSTVTRRV